MSCHCVMIWVSHLTWLHEWFRLGWNWGSDFLHGKIKSREAARAKTRTWFTNYLFYWCCFCLGSSNYLIEELCKVKFRPDLQVKLCLCGCRLQDHTAVLDRARTTYCSLTLSLTTLCDRRSHLALLFEPWMRLIWFFAKVFIRTKLFPHSHN